MDSTQTHGGRCSQHLIHVSSPPQGMLKHGALGVAKESQRKHCHLPGPPCTVVAVPHAPHPCHVLLPRTLCSVCLRDARGRSSAHKPSFWGDEVAVTQCLTPRSSGCPVCRAGSHPATGSLPLLSVLSLSTKAMLSSERKTRPSPEPEGKNLTDSKCSGDCGDPGSSGWWRSGIVGEK